MALDASQSQYREDDAQAKHGDGCKDEPGVAVATVAVNVGAGEGKNEERGHTERHT